jgi:hypothetical protein
MVCDRNGFRFWTSANAFLHAGLEWQVAFYALLLKVWKLRRLGLKSIEDAARWFGESPEIDKA